MGPGMAQCAWNGESGGSWQNFALRAIRSGAWRPPSRPAAPGKGRFGLRLRPAACRVQNYWSDDPVVQSPPVCSWLAMISKTGARHDARAAEL